MKHLCDSIETLAMALHDGELAGEELRDVELHLTECEACRDHTAAQATAIGTLRRKLAAPPAPDLLRARVLRGLDAEDKATRRPLTTWLLPGSAAVAAVAALALFLTGSPPAKAEKPVEKIVAASAARNRPPEVQGVATTRWVHQHYDPSVALPTFAEARFQKWGARLTDVLDREAVEFISRVVTPEGFERDLRITVFDARGIGFGGRRVEVNGRTLYVGVFENRAVVSYRDGLERGYMFHSNQMTLEELTELVGTSSLLMQIREGERSR